MENKKLSISTLCVQAGWTPGNGEPVEPPIVQSTTFKYDDSDEMAQLFDLKKSGYFYTRLQNPTNDAVASKIAALEGGVGAMLTSSGQAANFYAVLNICGAGDHIVASTEIYGGTFNLFSVTLKKMGIDCTFVSQEAPEEEIAKAFRKETKLLFGETISNPGCRVLDIEKFAHIAHTHGVPLIVDNTFATPVNCRPFEWGADIVTHSTTKYMDGHAATVGGVIVDSGTARRLISRPDLHQGVRKAGLHNQADSSAHARPRLNTFAPQCLHSEPWTRKPAPPCASALRQCTARGRVSRR